MGDLAGNAAKSVVSGVSIYTTKGAELEMNTTGRTADGDAMGTEAANNTLPALETSRDA